MQIHTTRLLDAGMEVDIASIQAWQFQLDRCPFRFAIIFAPLKDTNALLQDEIFQAKVKKFRSDCGCCIYSSTTLFYCWCGRSLRLAQSPVVSRESYQLYIGENKPCLRCSLPMVA